MGSSSETTRTGCDSPGTGPDLLTRPPSTDYITLSSTDNPMTRSTDNLTAIAQSLPEGVTPKVKVLKSAARKTRRSVLTKTNSSGRSGLGSHDTAKGSYVAAGDIAIGAGRMGTLNPVNSLGRQWVGDKNANAQRAASQYAADRRAAARDRLMDRIDSALAL